MPCPAIPDLLRCSHSRMILLLMGSRLTFRITFFFPSHSDLSSPIVPVLKEALTGVDDEGSLVL